MREEANARYVAGAMRPIYGCAGVEMDVPAARRLERKSKPLASAMVSA
jgi:hypothetical protein